MDAGIYRVSIGTAELDDGTFAAVIEWGDGAIDLIEPNDLPSGWATVEEAQAEAIRVKDRLLEIAKAMPGVEHLYTNEL